MNKIETKILNCFAVKEAEKNMVFAARLTQRGHSIHSMNDLVDLYNQSFTNETLTHLGELPHPAIPYEIISAHSEIQALYLESCQEDMNCYDRLCKAGISHDAAGYATPQGLRNVLIISATPYQWKHMIGQRCCRRNTDEMRHRFFTPSFFIAGVIARQIVDCDLVGSATTRFVLNGSRPLSTHSTDA